MIREKLKEGFSTLVIMILCLSVLACIALLNVMLNMNGDLDALNNPVESRISLSFYGSDERDSYMLDALSSFEDAYDYIDVTSAYGMEEGYKTRLDMLKNAGELSDVMLLSYDWFEEYMRDDVFYDLSKSDVIDTADIDSDELVKCQSDGKTYGIPVSTDVLCFAYNSDLLQHYSLSIPTTWEELMADGDIVRQDGKTMLYMSQEDTFFMIYAWLIQNGMELFDEEGNYIGSKEALKAGISFYEELVSHGVISPENTEESFQEQNTIGVASMATKLKSVCQPVMNAKHNVRLGRPFTMDGGTLTGWYALPGCVYAVSKNTDETASSAELVNYLINDTDLARSQGIEKGIPVNAEARQTLQGRGLASGLVLGNGSTILDEEAALEPLNPRFKKQDVASAFFAAAEQYESSQDMESAASSLASALQD